MVARLKITADQRELNKYLKKLDKNRGKPLLVRAERVINAGARLLIPPIRSQPIMRRGHGTEHRKPGNLKRRVHQRYLKKRAGEDIRPTWVGSSAYYMRFVAEGTRQHDLAAKGGLVSFTTGLGESVSFTKSVGGRAAFAKFPSGDIRPWSAVHHPGAKGDPFMARVWSSYGGTVYTRISRDIWDTK